MLIPVLPLWPNTLIIRCLERIWKCSEATSETANPNSPTTTHWEAAIKYQAVINENASHKEETHAHRATGPATLHTAKDPPLDLPTLVPSYMGLLRNNLFYSNILHQIDFTHPWPHLSLSFRFVLVPHFLSSFRLWSSMISYLMRLRYLEAMRISVNYYTACPELSSNWYFRIGLISSIS